MSWTTKKKWVVFKAENDIYHWERLENMSIYKDFDLFIPILFTDRQNIAIQTAIKLNKYHEKRQGFKFVL